MMTFKQLFDLGDNYHQYLGRGTADEIAAVSKVTDLLNHELKISTEQHEHLLTIKEEIHFLIAGEPWCPFCQLQLSVLNKFCELNPAFKMSVISKGRAEDEIQSRLELDEILIPVVVVLDKDFEQLGFFVECPSENCPPYELEALKNDSESGGYLNRTAADLLKILASR